jgi:hypothetical protein
MNTLKYRLFELLAQRYGRFITAGMFKLSEATHVSYRTIQRDVYREPKDGCIPEERLKAYASFFGVEVEELKNKNLQAV